jgi:hypothetical protein
MSRLSRIALIVAAVAFPTAGLVAHVRLVHPSNGTPLRWSNPATVSIVINATGSDDIADGSHETSLRMAIQDWNAVTGTTATLVEDASDVSQARTDWSSTGIHLIYFDETNESGSSDRLVDRRHHARVVLLERADPGRGRAVQTARDSTSRPRVRPAASTSAPWARTSSGTCSGSTTAGRWGPRSTRTWTRGSCCSAASRRTMRTACATRTRRGRGAASAGRSCASRTRRRSRERTSWRAMPADAPRRRRWRRTTERSTLRGLDPDVYTVYARPLDNPVDAGNLGSGHAGAETDFEPAVYAATATITGGETLDLGELPVGDDVALNLGTAGDQFPARVVVGQSSTYHAARQRAVQWLDAHRQRSGPDPRPADLVRQPGVVPGHGSLPASRAATST